MVDTVERHESLKGCVVGEFNKAVDNKNPLELVAGAFMCVVTNGGGMTDNAVKSMQDHNKRQAEMMNNL